MPGTPHEWNVVILGAWNLAILTPGGIGRRLFALPEGTPLEVHVSVDQPGVIRVRHEGAVVSPTRGRLEIAPTESTVERLANAAMIGQRALQSLPETPVTAAGVNFRYQFEALPDPVLDFMASSLDDALADAGHTINGRYMRRSVVWQDGIVNIEIDQKDNASGLVSFNFHRASTDTQVLRAWLGQVAEMGPAASAFLTTMKAAE